MRAAGRPAVGQALGQEGGQAVLGDEVLHQVGEVGGAQQGLVLPSAVHVVIHHTRHLEGKVLVTVCTHTHCRHTHCRQLW